MKSILRWAIHNTPAMNTGLVVLLVAGMMSLMTMRRESFPEFDLEMILVSVPYPGASPSEAEEGICQKIEEAVRSVDGIKKQTSVAQEGAGFVILELQSKIQDPQRVLNEVRSEIDRIPSFPELAEDPEIEQVTLRDPAIRVAVMGPAEEGVEAELRLRSLVEQIRDDLLMLSTVSQANILGEKPYQIDIEIDESTLRKHNLNLRQVAEIVRRQNVEIPAGNLKAENQEILLRGKNKRLIGEEIAEIPLVTKPGGVVLTVGDLGTVRDAFEDTDSKTRINGRPGMVVSIDRTSSEDLLSMAAAVRQYVKETPLPSGYEMTTWMDQSIDVQDRLDMLVRNGVQGLLLVFLVLTIFLEMRLAFWVALGIPVSILGAGAAMLWMGHTLNMLSMFGFLMALGIVVDDAIVIGENVYEHRQRGRSWVEAAVIGTYEVLPSVIASISTTIIAFIPLLYVSGVMGKFIAVLPVVVIAMLIVSLIEGMFVLPCHLAHDPDEKKGSLLERVHAAVRKQRGPLRWTFGAVALAVVFLLQWFVYPLRRLGAVFHWLSEHFSGALDAFAQRVYRPTLRWAIAHPGIVISVSFAVLMMAAGLVSSGITPFIVFPKIDSNWITAKVVYPDGTPAAAADAATLRMEQALLRVAERHAEDNPNLIRVMQRTVGVSGADGGMGPMDNPAGAGSGSHTGSLVVEMLVAEKRTVGSDQIIAEWREEAGDFPGAEEVTFGTPNFGPGGTPIEFKLLADANHMDELEAAVDEAKAKLAQYAGVFDIADDSRPGKWEFQLTVKPSAEALGVPLADLAGTVRAAYYGEEVMRLQRGRHEVKLMVRYPREDRRRLADFNDIRVTTTDGTQRPIHELADVNVERGYSEINRVDQLRSITVTADIDESRGNAAKIVQDLKANFLPDLFQEYPHVRVRWEGQQEQTTESLDSLRIGMVVALLGMFALLTLEFRSYLQPLMILAIIPFGAIGAILGHAAMDMPLTMFSVFGLVALTGVVVNDSIVLIDFINHRIKDGLPLGEAIVDAGARRLRPVLLTSITTVAGLLPILVEKSFQAQIVIPMAASICFGLMAATVLILVLIPAFYSVYGRFVLGEKVVMAPSHPGPPDSLPEPPTPEPVEAPPEKVLVR